MGQLAGTRARRFQVYGTAAALGRTEAIVLAVPWGAARSAVEGLGNLAGKVLIDATNPLGPGLSLAADPSGGEQVARWAGKENHLMSQRLSLYAVAALALMSVSAVMSNAQTQQDSSTDEAAIRQIVVQHIQDAWNAKDGRAFAASFAPDADYVNVIGGYSKGREVIEKEHTAIFSTIHKESHSIRTVKSIRFLRPDVAVVHVEGRLLTRAGGEPRGHNINLMVMTKENGKWSIAAFQNTPIREQGR